ncbi:MAG TPA: L,D-transpeptidase [Longimicrobiales bacterium]
MRKWIGGIAALAVLLAAGIAFISTRPPVEEGISAVSFEDASLRVLIDISDRRLYVEEDGEQIASYGVAVGTASHPTPRGSFTVQRIIWNPRWVPPDSEWAKDERPREPGDPKNPMGRVKIFFREPTYYVHGTNAEGSIGRAASHGCVRMLNDDVIDLAQTLMEHGGAPAEPGLIQRLINRVRQTREVGLTDPIPLRVRS